MTTTPASVPSKGAALWLPLRDWIAPAFQPVFRSRRDFREELLKNQDSPSGLIPVQHTLSHRDAKSRANDPARLGVRTPGTF
jgi:hypothetical protein